MFKGGNEPDRKYFDFNDIRLKIESETDRLAGKKVRGSRGYPPTPPMPSPPPAPTIVTTTATTIHQGLTVDAILLDIYSPNVLDLTLVDLPGAVRTVAEGQDLDTPAKIQQM